MTLAEILLVGIFCAVPAAPFIAATRQAAPPSPSQNKSPKTEGTQDQGAASQSTPSNTSQPPSAATAGTTPAGKNPSTTKKRRHKKRVTASNCNSTPTASGQAASSSNS